jgi:hypothetical protein
MRRCLLALTLASIAACGRPGGRCDQAALRAAADASDAMFTAWQPQAGALPDYLSVARGLRSACPALPEGFHFFLDNMVYPVPERRSYQLSVSTPLRDDAEALRPFLAHCPGLREHLGTVGTLPGDARTPYFYNACRLKELGVFTPDELPSSIGDPQGWNGHALYLWLVDDGAPPDVARRLVRPIVGGSEYMFPRSDELAALPYAARGAPAGWQSMPLRASREAIIFDNKRLVDLTVGALDESVHAGGLIGPLFDTFAEEVNKSVMLNAAIDPTSPIQLAIAADPRLPWATVGRIAWTGIRAEFTRIDAHALTDNPIRPLVAVPLFIASDAPPAAMLELAGPAITVRCTDSFHTLALPDLLAALKKCSPGPLRLVATRETTWQQVLDVLVVLQGEATISTINPPP